MYKKSLVEIVNVGKGVAHELSRGTTEQGEYRSQARMAMIEPISWDLIEEKVQPSPSYTERFNMKRAFFAPN